MKVINTWRAENKEWTWIVPLGKIRWLVIKDNEKIWMLGPNNLIHGDCDNEWSNLIPANINSQLFLNYAINGKAVILIQESMPNPKQCKEAFNV